MIIGICLYQSSTSCAISNDIWALSALCNNVLQPSVSTNVIQNPHLLSTRIQLESYNRKVKKNSKSHWNPNTKLQRYYVSPCLLHLSFHRTAKISNRQPLRYSKKVSTATRQPPDRVSITKFEWVTETKQPHKTLRTETNRIIQDLRNRENNVDAFWGVWQEVWAPEFQTQYGSDEKEGISQPRLESRPSTLSSFVRSLARAQQRHPVLHRDGSRLHRLALTVWCERVSCLFLIVKRKLHLFVISILITRTPWPGKKFWINPRLCRVNPNIL